MTERDDPMYSEFADTDLSKWPFVSSRQAVAEMKKLTTQHHLGFVFNPGGGAFTGTDFRCQISTGDDVRDLNKLRIALSDLTSSSSRQA